MLLPYAAYMVTLHGIAGIHAVDMRFYIPEPSARGGRSAPGQVIIIVGGAARHKPA
jgi:hypothetical protein